MPVEYHLDAYNEGRQAHNKGQAFTDNPHKSYPDLCMYRQSNKYLSWNAGWNDALKTHADTQEKLNPQADGGAGGVR